MRRPIICFELTLAVGKTNGEGLGLRLAFADVGGGVPNPAAVAAYIGRQLHIGDNCMPLARAPSQKQEGALRPTVVVGADFERLVPAHDKARLAVLLVLQ